MASPTNDPNIFPLKQLITSSPPTKSTANSVELEKIRLIPPGLSDVSRKFSLFFFSCTKVDSALLQQVAHQPDFPILGEHVLNHPVLQHFPVRNSFRLPILKELVNYVDPDYADMVFNSLASCVGAQSEYSYRLYADSDGLLFCVIRESNQQLCYGTTGLSLWQASCDLSHFLSNFVHLDNKHVVELGAGCGLAGISAAASCQTCTVSLTDYDPKVLQQLELNVDANFPHNNQRVEVSHMDWSEFLQKQQNYNADIVIASDVVYDKALFPHLCTAIHSLLEKSHSFALIASTLRDPDTLKAFRREIESHNLCVKDEARYYREIFEFTDGSTMKSIRSFPFYSSLDTPTIFFYIVRS